MTKTPQNSPKIDISALTPAQQAALEAEVKSELWRRGDLSWKLDETQVILRAAREKALGLTSGEAKKPPIASATATALSIAERIAAADRPISFFELCARGNGKSFELLVLAIETALRTKDRRILYVAPLRDDAEKIAKDIIELFILFDCPKELRPEWRAGDGEYAFKNGSTIRFRGTNNESVERLRGFGYHLVILDECGVMDDLRYIVGIVRPLAERLGGYLVLATTPGKTPDHDSTALYGEHLERNAAIKFTMNDNPRLSWEEKARILLNEGERREDVAGILDGTKKARQTNTLRERFCLFVSDANMAVLPEYQEFEARLVVSVAREGRPARYPVRERPEHFHAYVAMDPGIANKTAVLFAYYDFLRNVVVVEGEAFVRGREASTDGIADAIDRNEIALWGAHRDAGCRSQPHKRVSDHDLRLVHDLNQTRGLRFSLANKKDSAAGLALVRTMLGSDPPQIEIDESCVVLRHQMQNATWNRQGTDLAAEKDGGHFDGVAALKYLCRAVDRTLNPYPPGWTLPLRTADSFRRPDPPKADPVLPATPLARKMEGYSRGVMARIFGARRR